MRVISGKSRGTKIKTIESDSTRPTLDRVKESLFNIIQNEIKDKVVLDLFAGSGALGIEALSRGAKRAYFCDKNIEAIKVIKQNLEKTKLTEVSKVIYGDYKKCITELSEQMDIIFIDPPYKDDLAITSIKLIIEMNILKDNGIIIIETDEVKRDKQELEKIKGIGITDERKYGRASLIFIKKN